MDNNNDKHKRIVRNRRIAIGVSILLLSSALFLVLFGVITALKNRKDIFPPKEEPEVIAEESEEPQDIVDIVDVINPEKPETKEPEEAAEGPDVGQQYEEVVEKGEKSVDVLEIQEKVSGLSLEEKIAQLFFVRPEDITGADTVTMAGDVTKAAIEKYHVGGIIYFSKNLLEPDQTAALLENTVKYSSQGNGIPFFLGIDEEGGSVTRLASNESFDLKVTDPAQKIGLSSDTEEAYRAGDHIGSYLKDLKFNVDFAPVADVTAFPGVAIGDRSFGSDPKKVSKMASEFARGLNDNDVIACYKHFPGFGRAGKNTDFAAVSIDAGTDALKETDLIPYQEGVGSGIQMIMAGNMSFPNVTGDDAPACMSPLLINDYLRGELSFNGVVVTDALNAAAITEKYDSAAASVNALKAGCDMLLCPADFEAAYNGIIEAVNSGELSEDVVDRAVGRILSLKEKTL